MQQKILEESKEKEYILALINDAIKKKDRYVTLYFGEHGIQVSIYPMEDKNVS